MVISFDDYVTSNSSLLSIAIRLCYFSDKVPKRGVHRRYIPIVLCLSSMDFGN